MALPVGLGDGRNIAGGESGGELKHGELASEECGGKTNDAQLLRRLLEGTSAFVSSADRDGPLPGR